MYYVKNTFRLLYASRNCSEFVYWSWRSEWIVRPNPVLSIRAGSRPKQPATGQSLAGYFLLTLLLILVRNLKWGKDPTKIYCETSASNVWVKIKPHFGSLKRVYLSHARWKLIEGFWNACDIFREQNPAKNRLKIMKRSRKNNCKTSGSNVRV